MSETLRFVERLGRIYRVLIEELNGYWLIDCDTPSPPFFEADCAKYDRVPTPENWMTEQTTPAQAARLHMIQPLLDCDDCISDKALRYRMAAESAQQHQTTTRRILRLYYRYLATGRLIQKRAKQISKNSQIIAQAIRHYYFGARRLSLRSAYEMMLLEDYVGPDGQLDSDAPTWSQFRHYYYEHSFHKSPQKIIAREGITKYQRDHRPVWGSSAGWRPQPGSYQMDATQADIYLVSRQDRSVVVGRPYIYLAVDTATHLIAGVYVGMDAGEQAVINCLSNAAADKVSFCKRYGLDIKKEEWPNTGLPGEIITDKGREFIGTRMNELAMKYGIEFESLPPFRPDGKGLVEKSFDLIQQRYKPALRGKGVIEADAQERWAVDYRSQAVLTLEEFTKVILSCILYLNSCRVIENRFCKDADPVAAAMWMECEKEKRSLVIPINSEELYRFGLPRTSATLNRRGICYQGLWYVSENYKEFLESHNRGEIVRICYDPEDVSRLFLLNGMNYIPFELSRHSKQYAGATESEYQMKRKAERDSRKESELRDTEGRVRLLKDIESVVKQAEYRDKNKISTKRMEQAKEMERA